MMQDVKPDQTAVKVLIASILDFGSLVIFM
jgi:hypothetical protein